MIAMNFYLESKRMIFYTEILLVKLLKVIILTFKLETMLLGLLGFKHMLSQMELVLRKLIPILLLLNIG